MAREEDQRPIDQQPIDLTPVDQLSVDLLPVDQLSVDLLPVDQLPEDLLPVEWLPEHGARPNQTKCVKPESENAVDGPEVFLPLHLCEEQHSAGRVSLPDIIPRDCRVSQSNFNLPDIVKSSLSPLSSSNSQNTYPGQSELSSQELTDCTKWKNVGRSLKCIADTFQDNEGLATTEGSFISSPTSSPSPSLNVFADVSVKILFNVVLLVSLRKLQSVL